MSNFKDLKVWHEAIKLTTDIYNLTKHYPKDELYGITNQIRRCAVSIPSNIAEGSGRISDKEFKHFLSISNGSIAELETQLIISHNIQYISKDQLSQMISQISLVRKMLSGLMKSLKY